ncbi:MAG: hypothetical protein U9N51_09405 [Bacteroidota bacterium]|nr:hypothetical protein [Bacteroidota bacterium]
MRKIGNAIILVLSVSVLIFSCKSKPEPPADNVVVIVHDRSLYYSDLDAVIPSYFVAEDSAEIADNYISSWVNHELIYHYAKQRLRDTMEIHQKIQNYRRELFRYEMENQYVKSNLDSAFSVDEVTGYYTEHLGEYELEELAVKVHYIIMDAEVASYYYEMDKVRRSSPGNMDLLYNAEKRSNVQVFEHTDWIYFSDLLEEINANLTSEIEYGLQLGYFTTLDDENRYIVKINDKKMSGDTVPMSLIYSDIERILLNQRQAELLDNFVNDLYQDAKSKKNIVYKEN